MMVNLSDKRKVLQQMTDAELSQRLGEFKINTESGPMPFIQELDRRASLATISAATTAKYAAWAVIIAALISSVATIVAASFP